MAITSLSVTSATAFLTAIRDALVARGVWEATKYLAADSLIVKTTRSDKVFKFFPNGGLQVGDAWTSGATITNGISVNNGIDTLPIGAQLVVTPDVIALITRHTSGPSVLSSYIVKTDGGLNVAIGFCVGSTSTASGALISSGAGTLLSAFPINRLLGIINDGVSYISQPILIAGYRAMEYKGKLLGMKFLGKNSDSTVTHTVSGDHVITAGGFCNENISGTGIQYASIIIENGAI